MSYPTYARIVSATVVTIGSAMFAWIGLNVLSLSIISVLAIVFGISAGLGLIYRRIGPSESKKERIENRLE